MEQLDSIANAVGGQLENALEELSKQVGTMVDVHCTSIKWFHRLKSMYQFFGKTSKMVPTKSGLVKMCWSVHPWSYVKLNSGQQLPKVRTRNISPKMLDIPYLMNIV